MGRSSKDINKILAGSSTLATYNICLQLVFWVFTHLLYAFELRHVSKETLGIANVRLPLLYTTVLFTTRSAFRRACLGTNTSSNNKEKSSRLQWMQTINLVWFILPLGIVFSTAAIYVWNNVLKQPDESQVPHYTLSVYIFGACACLKLAIEPMWLIAQAFLFIKLKATTEVLAFFVKCAVIVVLAIFYPDLGLMSFSIAQISLLVVNIGILYGYFIWFVLTDKHKQLDDFPFTRVRDFFPRSIPGQPFVDTKMVKLTISFFKQSILRRLLSEGERYVMTILNVLSFADQGVYEIVTSLGSFVYRLLFLPIEESLTLFFAKTLKRGDEIFKQTKEEIVAVSNVLFCILRLVVLISLTVFTFILPYSKLLLDVYGGSVLSGAINGSTETFVFASMDQSQVERYNKKMLLFSLLFLVSSYYLTNAVGSVGFIIANCLNMMARIIHSFYFINRLFTDISVVPSPLKGIVPERKVLVVLFSSAVIGLVSESYLCCDTELLPKIIHLAIGCICFSVCCITMRFIELSVSKFLHQQYFKKHME